MSQTKNEATQKSQVPGPATQEMLEWSRKCLENFYVLQIPDAVHRAFLEEWRQGQETN